MSGTTLYLMRHGQAEPASFDGDRARQLIAEGQREVESVAAHLAKLDIAPRTILSSPYRRTEQTAVAVAQTAGLAAPVLEPALASGARAEAMAAAILQLLDKPAALVVGHMPDLSELLRYYVPQKEIRFLPAGVACVAFPERPTANSGTFVWYRSPFDW